MKYLNDPNLSGPAVLSVLRDHGQMHFKALCSYFGIKGLTMQGTLIEILVALHGLGLILSDIPDFGVWESNVTVELSPTVRELTQVLGLSIQELVERDPQKSTIFKPLFGCPTVLPASDSADLFVLMPFCEILKPIYDDHIKPVAKKLGLIVKRGDDFFTTHNIMKDVWNSICGAKVIIADCTYRSPNVFYEIGLAHTVGKPVVLITQDSDAVPFDLRSVRYIQYQYTPPGMRKFERTLRQTIQDSMQNLPKVPTIKHGDVLTSKKKHQVKEKEMMIDLGGDVTIEMVRIPSGTFQMGSSDNEQYGNPHESPAHTVTISKYFYIGKYNVTQGQWQAVMKSNPSEFKKGDNYPVEKVSWNDCQKFIDKLNKIVGVQNFEPPHVFRLPTEAEWEYACRAGSVTTYYWGDSMDETYCWHNKNSGKTTHLVGEKKPNAWGLYDMSGNVWEWCQDLYESCLSSSAVIDPIGPAVGSSRVFRGGSWHYYETYCRSSIRGNDCPTACYRDLGFRLVFSSDQSN
jgi:formylglycine-generating enzyme required for sulfatase activity